MKKTIILFFTLLVGAAAFAQTTWDLNGNFTNGETFGTTNPQDLNIITNGFTRMTLKSNGEIGIGTTSTTGFKLSVDGKIRSREVFINLDTWADSVFSPNYELMPITKLELFLDSAKHLPEVPTEYEMISKEVSVGDNQTMMIKKIEELTLYIIQLNGRIEELEKEKGVQNDEE